LTGWNSRQSVVLLKEFLEAHSQRGLSALQPPIVILGGASKVGSTRMNKFGVG